MIFENEPGHHDKSEVQPPTDSSCSSEYMPLLFLPIIYIHTYIHTYIDRLILEGNTVASFGQ